MSIRGTFGELSNFIYISRLKEIFDKFNSLCKKNSQDSIYYETVLYKDTNSFYIEYRGNKILTYTPETITFHNTNWYSNPSTAVRVNKLLPKRLSLQTVDRFMSRVGLEVGLEHVLTISPDGDLRYWFERPEYYYYCPLLEGMVVTEADCSRFDINHVNDWYVNVSKTIKPKLFKGLYDNIQAEAFTRNVDIWVYINTNLDNPNNVLVKNLTLNRKLPSLTSHCKKLINPLLEESDLTTDYDNVITFVIRNNTFSSIEKVKHLLDLQAS